MVSASKDKNRILIDAILLCILLFAGMTSASVTVGVAALLGLSFLIRNKADIVYSLLFFYSFYCIFKPTPNGTSLFNVVMAFAIIGLVIQKKEKSWVISLSTGTARSLILLSVLCVYLFIIGEIRGRNDFLTIGLDLFIPMLLVIAVSMNREKIDISNAIYAYVIGIIIAQAVGAGIIPVKNLSAYVSLVHFKAAGIRLTRFQGLTVNPNYFSLDVNMAIAGLLIMPEIRGDKKRTRGEIVLLGLLILTGLLTLSKSFATCLVATIILYILLGAERRKLERLIKFILPLSVLLAAYDWASGTRYISAIILRFGNASTLEELTSSRTIVWIDYLKYILTHPDYLILGAGAGAGRLQNYGASHSFYIECLYYFGTIGCILFAAFIYSMLHTTEARRIYYLPAIVFLIRGFAINIVLREAFSTDLIIMMLFIRYRSTLGDKSRNLLP